MSNKLLPNAVCLITMSDDELREELLRDIYSGANLREMIRRLAKLSMDYAKMADYEKQKTIGYKNVLRQIKSALSDIDE